MCCTWLAENPGRKKMPKMTEKISIWAPFHKFVGLYLRNLGMYRQSKKKLVKQQYLLHMCPQYGELRPTSGWDRLTSLGCPCILRRWTEGATYIRQGDHHVGHWPTFLVIYCKSPDKSILKPSLILYLQVTQPISNMFFWSPYGIGQTIIFSCCGLFFLLLLLSFPRLMSAAADWTSAILPHMVWS